MDFAVFYFDYTYESFRKETIHSLRRQFIAGDCSNILQGKNDAEPTANKKFLALWEPVLDESRSMKYPFDSLKTVSILTSKDNKVRFINWVIPKTTELTNIKQLYSITITKTNTMLCYLEAIEEDYVNLKK